MAQARRVRGPVACGAGELGGRALLGGADDDSERADPALRLQAEDAAHALEGDVRVRAPFPVDLQPLARSERQQVAIEAGLQIRYVRAQTPRFIELPHGGIRVLAQDRDTDLRNMWRFGR
jgi:hypothetical protein